MQKPLIPILAYHKIEDRPDFGVTTRKISDFKEDLHLLKEHGYQTVTFKELDRAEALPPNPVIITFDDGYESFYTQALPLLLELGLKAVVFIPTAFAGHENDWDVQWGNHRYRHMDKAHIVECHRRGMEIGSHMVHHLYPGFLDDRRLEYELIASKEQLSRWTGDTVISLSYPFGKYNARVVSAASQHYRYAVGQSAAVLVNGRPSPLFLPRVNVYRMDSSHQLIKKTERAAEGIFSLRDRLIQKGAWASIALQYFKQTSERKTGNHAQVN